MNLSRFATARYRWVALVVIALALAIVIIDNTVLNVAVPYILRDLNTNFEAMQWVISGYALIIASLLITVGRLGDVFGRKRLFLIGGVIFAIGSFIASIAPNIFWLFFGEAFIEAIGASMLLTSSLSLIASEFHGKERAVAFGIWGSVAGAAASIGPLLGGFLTTYYSWRWSLRINVIVVAIAILGSVFIQESKGESDKGFDFLGTILSASGLFLLVFGLIEGRTYGWINAKDVFQIGNFVWTSNTSIVPFAFGLSLLLLILFGLWEMKLERDNRNPLLRISMFKNIGFLFGLLTLGILSMGLIGTFIILTIYLQNSLGFDAFKTGLVFLYATISMAVFGPLTGFIASKVGPKWISTAGMFVTSIGIYVLSTELSSTATQSTFAPGLILFGAGLGMASAQLTNIVLSQVHISLAGEASALNNTMRQVGSSIGIAILGTILASNIMTNIPVNIQNDSQVPSLFKSKIIDAMKNVNVESGVKDNPQFSKQFPEIAKAVKMDVSESIVTATRDTMHVGLIFTIIGAFLSLLIPKVKSKQNIEVSNPT